MKRTMIYATGILLALTCAPTVARADWRVGFSVGFEGGRIAGTYSRHDRQHRPHVRPVHVCTPVPIYSQVWVPPVYQSVIVGYDWCGQPIFRTVCVRAGYHRQVIVGYRCSGCRLACR